MRRRAVVLAILALAACVGDQPTEPTYEGEGFLAAPPPAPAPPTELSGELAGGDGYGVSTDLGFYESPVFVTARVEGTLTYSGRPDGYLPGTGQVDAAGILVQNQCDLTVVVRWATAQTASALSLAPTCYYPARSVGSYVRRFVVQGALSTYRTAGPPLSCYKGITPCVSYTGTETVTITPEEGKLLLTPNKTSASIGGGIYVTAKGVWATDGTTPVPFAVREWRWEGSGPELGGGHTKVCAVYNPGQCIVQVYQSGYVVLEAVVNGKVKTERTWIMVQGGDTLPPPPPDSLPGGGDGDGDDGDGGGDGGDGGSCGTCCGDSTGTGPQTAACQPPEPPKATVECKGPAGLSTIVRGATVSCSVVVTPSQTFSVTGWQATPEGGTTKSFPGSTTLIGPAVVSTEVGATVTLADGTALNAAPASFSVVARAWAKYQLPDQAPYLHARTFDSRGELTRGQIRLGMVLGVFRLNGTDFNYADVDKAATGPNAGYVFFKTAPVLLAPHVYTHPQFGGGEWYDDQNFGRDPSTRAARCGPAAVPVLEGKVEVHEGVTRSTESHWWVAHELLEFSRLTETWEASVDASGNEDGLRQLAWDQHRAMFDRMGASQKNFDDYDYPRVFGSLGCALDMDPSRGDG